MEKLWTIALLLLTVLGAAQDAPMPSMHGGMGEGVETPAVANRFGTVRFETSCKPLVRADFNDAVALLHSFEYEEARAAFLQVGKKDPDCAMVQWGVAMTYFHGMWGEFNGAAGSAAVAEARRLASAHPDTTKRELAYISAIGVLFSEEALKAGVSEDNKPDAMGYSGPPAAFEGKYTEAMAELHREFPEDRETTIFYALALNISAKRTDKTHADVRQCMALLKPLFVEMPNHPGVAHYIIHCNDNPEMAADGLEAARKYAQIAPASSHATHMPAHIFAQLGLWDEMAESNRVSMRVAETGPRAASCDQVGNAMHAMSFLVVALGEMGELTEARKVYDHALKVRDGVGSDAACTGEANLAAATYIAETGEWTRAKDIKVDGGDRSTGESLLWLTIGIGAAAAGDAVLETKAEEALAGMRDARGKMPGQTTENAYEALRLALVGYETQAAGKPAEAVGLLRTGADLQDRLGSGVSTYKPVREMLADTLMAHGDFAAALVEYKAALDRQPNRFDSLYGAGSAAYALGDKVAAKVYYSRMLRFARGEERPELAVARRRVGEEVVAAVR